MAADNTTIKHHEGRIVASTTPMPSARKNNPIVFLKAPKNIFSLLYFDIKIL